VLFRSDRLKGESMASERSREIRRRRHRREKALKARKKTGGAAAPRK